MTENVDKDKIDVGIIANAVAQELARLNKDNSNTNNKGDNQKEVFKCPDCGASVIEGARICGGCGCELEWEE